MKIRKLAIISTGGTIGSVNDDMGIRTVGSPIQLLNEMLRDRPDGYPEIAPDVVSPFTLLSENIIPGDWAVLATSIYKVVSEGAESVIVTHGTDTIAYSMAAISLFFNYISVPIVFIGSNYPYGHKDSQAHKTLWDSILFVHEFREPGVYLLFKGSSSTRSDVLWGPIAQSMRPSDITFSSMDKQKVAEIENKKIYIHRTYPIAAPAGPILMDVRLSTDVALVRLYPGYRSDFLKDYFKYNLRAIILGLYHSGTGCVRDNKEYYLVDSVNYLTQQGIVVIGCAATSQMTEQYKSTKSLIGAGMRPISGMTLEMAYVKAMVLLGRETPENKLYDKMKAMQVSEIVGRDDEN